jgi:amino acid adenylation domain-containing protein
MYRVGDLVRYRVDGILEFLGRIDHQVKVRGFRVEPGEVESALLAHPAVRAAAVLPSGGALRAYLETAPGAVAAGELRQHLKARLPEYMVPSAYTFLESLPLTPNGKVDRRALAALPLAAGEAGGAEAPRTPQTPAEELVAGIFAEVLGLERVGAGDSFFELGGHSLVAIRALSRLREAFGVSLPVKVLFEAPTVSALAEAVTAVRRETASLALPPLVPVPRGERLPLSFPQQRLWFMDRLAPESSTYNIPFACEIHGPLDLAALAAALTGIVHRHEILRSRFFEVDGQPWQEIVRPGPFPLPLIDLAGLPEERRRPLLERLGREEAGRIFDLRRGPLLRAGLLRLGSDDHALLLTQHHIVSDGVSGEILQRELAALYAAALAGEPSPLGEPRVQYGDFAVWQRAWPESVLERQLAYWRETLAGVATLEVPTDHPRPPVLTFNGRTESVVVPAATGAALRDLARGQRVTLFMTFLAVWQVVLQRLSGQTDLAVGTPVANRTRPEIEDVVGFFVNMLALRTDFGGDPSFAELLDRVRRVAMSAYDHTDVPFERLVDELSPGRDLSRQPLVQVMFTLQSLSPAPLVLPGATVEPLNLAGTVAKFDLTLELSADGSGFRGGIEYNTDLFDRPTVARLAGHFVNLVAAVAANPESRLSGLELLSAAERHQILDEWNDTLASFPETTLLHQFFEAAAERSPAAVAAVCAGRELTYGELEARSNRLAYLLREVGVERGTPVGVWVERSLDLLTAVLGVLKAGGHYVALDDTWPGTRVESILAATGAPAIVVGPGLLPEVEEMRWRLPALSDLVCLGLAEPEPPVETVDPESVRELWDYVAERAVDRVTAGGFVSAFTGLPFSEAEVDEYRDRVLSLAQPWLRPEARVLEIGNGSGLLLWELASRVGHVTGLDPSPLTQERNRERAEREEHRNVELLTGFAHEVGDLLDSGERFDLILLASTVQFFPGPRYLERVVRWALGRLAPSGTVLVADVLDARRREELRRAVEEHGGDAGAERRELYLDEDLFRDLGAEVSVRHRDEGFPNELRFRYDVLLTPGEAATRRKRLWTGWHVDQSPAGRLPVVAGPEDIAYVIHTSGSTGEPKGIVVQHRPVANLFDWLNRAFEVGPQDRGLFVTSLAFDLSVYDIFGILAAGGTVHVATSEELADPDRLVALLRSGGITLWDSAPAALVRLAPLFPAVPDRASRLRLVMLSGDWIPVTLPDRVRQSFPGARVMALGGATEATVWSNWYPVREVDPAWPSIPYGRPIANSLYHVLDAGFAPCPIGVAGDLYIGGDCLCAGYTRPELTAAAFLPDPYSPRPGMRLYRTGDRARYGVDGLLEFLGRLDQQVKIRGYRIELGEIEVALAHLPGVREAVVLAREDEPGDKRLVAYVVPSGGSAPSPAELRDGLRGGLPEYMLPSAFVLLEALPVTANGKLDRRALPAPQWSAAAEFEAPRTPVETALAGIWSEVLGVPEVGREDDFFELGGHSLLATQMVSRLREAFGVEVALRSLFERPKLAELAAVVEAAREAAEAPSGPALRAVPRTGEEALPLSFAQERLWFLEQLDPGSGTYNIPVTVELSGPLDVSALVSAFAGVVGRQESLRTTFVEIGGVPRQRIAPFVPAGLPQVDLAALPAAVAAGEAERLGREQEGRGFDLERGPLFRGVLVRLAGDRHRFLLTFHHVIADGWSIGVLVRELGELYAATLEGRPSLLPELPVQYADFARWQRQWLAGEQAAELAYWETRLGGEVASAELPTDRPRPAIQTFRGGRAQLVLPSDLTSRLKRFGRDEGVTLFMILLAATQALLSRQSGEPDVAVGAPVAGRQWTETEGLIGCFLNTLVLRTDLSGTPSFREMAARVRAVTLEAYSNQTVPFEAVLARLNLQRDLSRTPLFQVLFNMLNLPPAELSLPGLELRVLTPAEVPSKFDLTFYVAEADSQVGIHLVYNADLFDEARMADLLAQLELLLAQGVERPEEPVDHLSLVTPAARVLLPDPCEALPEPTFPPVARMFLDRAEALPEQAALCWSEGAWTYSQLAAQARDIALAAMASGAGPGKVTAVLGPRSPGLIASLLGVFLSGGVLLILDRRHPAARLRIMMEEAGPECLIHVGEPQPEDQWLRELGSLALLPVPAVPAALPGSLPGGPVTPVSHAGPDDPAYVFFTSGTTGRPKAVLGRQKGLSHFLTWQRETFGIGPGDRAAQLTGLSFDVVLRDIFTPLTSGAALYLPEEDDLSPERVLSWLGERGITLLHTVPSLASAWLGSAPRSGSDALRWTFFAGEPLLDRVVERWRAAFPRTGIVNLYGPTETTLAKCFYRVPAPAVEPVQPVGSPLPQTQALILAGERRCGIGEVGEIVIRTPFRSLGYLNNPEENRLRFRPNPFRSDPGDLLYFTGDRGRYRPDGILEILGRVDEQVKIRGVRVELGEVRAALGRHEGVWESALLVHEAGPGDHRLAAYVVPRPGSTLDREELRRHLRLELPEPMVPSAFVLLDALPLTPNGKIDRRALAGHAVEIPASGERRAPRTPVEEIVAGLWSEVLGLERVGADDNFFQLGGHSLTGARVVSRLRRELRVDLPLRVLFEAPTVAGLAAEIERRRNRDGAPERPAIASFHQDRSAPPPLSFAQERFWAGRELEARSVASTIPMMVLFEGPLDLACLWRALREIVDRHEALRTTFREDAGRPVQAVHPTVPVQLRTVDLEPLAPPHRMEEVRRWSTLDGRSHFDLERGPLFRLTLFRCAERENVLLFTVHHIAFDGWSNSVLVGELAALYNAFQEGRPSPLRPLAAQYQDFARWQRHILAGESLEREVTFWREHLRGALPLDLCGGRPRPARWTFEAGLETFTIPEELEKSLEAFSRDHCVSLFITLLAAFKALLHHEAERDDIVVTSLFANRNQVEIENLIGNFYAGLPLRTRLSGARTFRDLLERVRDVTLAAHEHPDILYEPVMEGLGFLEAGDRGGLATFRILFQLAKWPPAEQSLSDLKVTRLPFDTGKIRQDLSLFFSQSDGLVGRFKYNRDVLDRERVVRMRERLLQILRTVVADPDCPLAKLAHVPDE